MLQINPLRRESWRGHRRLVVDALCVLLLLLGVAHIALGLIAVWQSGQFRDFQVFQESAGFLLAGQSPYRSENLNPPIFILLTSPLGLLSQRAGWVIWQVCGAVTYWVTFVVVKPKSITTERVLLLVVLFASTSAQTLLGQVAWLLALPLGLAWRASKREQWWRAGAWFGLVLSIKPFLLPVLALGLRDRRWARLCVSAGGTAIVLTLLPLPIVGWGAYLEWWRLGQEAWHSVSQPTNASLAGTLYRWGWSSTTSIASCAVLWVVLLWGRWPRSRDHQWLGAIAACILTSPLGWIHYAGWLLPLLLAARISRPWRLVALAAGSLPPVVVASWPSLRPAYLISLLAFFIASTIDEEARESVENGGHTTVIDAESVGHATAPRS